MVVGILLRVGIGCLVIWKDVRTRSLEIYSGSSANNKAIGCSLWRIIGTKRERKYTCFFLLIIARYLDHSIIHIYIDSFREFHIESLQVSFEEKMLDVWFHHKISIFVRENEDHLYTTYFGSPIGNAIVIVAWISLIIDWTSSVVHSTFLSAWS